MARRLAALGLLLGAVLHLSACDLPQDPRGTLEGVRGDTLHVGLAEAPPWVERSSDGPTGVEPELIRRFARSLDAEVQWHWGSTEEHMETLAAYGLDVVIGGHTRASPWRKHVGLTTPYATVRILVVGPPGAPPVSDDLEGARVAVPAAGPIGAWIREHDGEPVPTEELGTATGLLAAPDWELRALGRDTLGLELARRRHVMTTPPGENAFLMALENTLDAADVPALLLEAAGGTP